MTARPAALKFQGAVAPGLESVSRPRAAKRCLTRRSGERRARVRRARDGAHRNVAGSARSEARKEAV